MVSLRRGNVKLDPEIAARYIRAVDELPRPVSSGSLFGNDHPLEIEVGFGKGRFLLLAATANAGVNYLGIETSRKCALFTAHRLAQAEFANVQLLVADARAVFSEMLDSRSVRAVHTFFPDPWWKRRHKKRRLYSPGFVRDVERVLPPDGQLNILTDVEEYFCSMERLLQAHTGLVKVAGSVESAWAGFSAISFAVREPPGPAEDETHRNGLDYRTHFQRKASQAGLRIFQARYVRP